jgi:hypothetical protein
VIYNQLDSIILLIQIWIGYAEFSFVGSNAMLTKTATAALAVGLSLAGLATPAAAGTILIFAENKPGGFVVIHDNGNGTTSLSTDIPVTITNLFGPLVPPNITDATFSLSALSSDHSTTVGVGPLALLTQQYTGSFTIDAPECSLVCLSGTFADSVMSGLVGGFSLTQQASVPPAAGLVFSSDVIPAIDLALNQAFALSKTALTNPVKDDCSSPLGCTLGSTSANVSGTFSANPMSTPETSTWVMLALGFAAMGFGGYRSSRTKIALID